MTQEHTYEKSPAYSMAKRDNFWMKNPQNVSVIREEMKFWARICIQFEQFRSVSEQRWFSSTGSEFHVCCWPLDRTKQITIYTGMLYNFILKYVINVKNRSSVSSNYIVRSSFQIWFITVNIYFRRSLCNTKINSTNNICSVNLYLQFISNKEILVKFVY